MTPPPAAWRLRQPFGPRTLLACAAAAALLALSARHSQIDRLAVLTAEYGAHVVGLREESQVARGVDRFVASAFPLVISEETPVERIEAFDPARLPTGARLETREQTRFRYDAAEGRMVPTVERETVLVRPGGYLLFVLGKMVESLEIALWGTILALLVGAPLAFFGTRGYTPHPVLHVAARGVAGFLRAMPELVSALLLVLAYGFGPMAGVLALGLHSAGFFGKFFADDVENADRGPQEALASMGAGRVKVLWYGALPQVLPQYVAYIQYIVERNVRMSTVIGVVGAGGIGIELKGRFDMFDFGHVTTILLVIFLTVLVLERLAQGLRKRLI